MHSQLLCSLPTFLLGVNGWRIICLFFFFNSDPIFPLTLAVRRLLQGPLSFAPHPHTRITLSSYQADVVDCKPNPHLSSVILMAVAKGIVTAPTQPRLRMSVFRPLGSSFHYYSTGTRVVPSGHAPSPRLVAARTPIEHAVTPVALLLPAFQQPTPPRCGEPYICHTPLYLSSLLKFCR